MLVSLTLKNWMSFKEETTFDMLPGRERRFSKRILHLKSNDRILSVSAIFGANAAGKSNFIKALKFMKDLVTCGTGFKEKILVRPYLFNTKTQKSPCSFNCLFYTLTEDTRKAATDWMNADNKGKQNRGLLYEFCFTADEDKIISESLIKAYLTHEVMLYKREGNKISFADKIAQNKQDELKKIFKKTKRNQLFLHSAVKHGDNYFIDAYNWFDQDLQIISPHERFLPFDLNILDKEYYFCEIDNLLSKLDTGIKYIVLEQSDGVERQLMFDTLINDKTDSYIKPGKIIRYIDGFLQRRYLLRKTKNEIEAYIILSRHYVQDAEDKVMEINFTKESDGVMKLFDMLPAFIERSSLNKNKVYVIDEFDSNLHPCLAERLIELFSENIDDKYQAQLIFSSQNALLIDFKKFRRDELWLVSKNKNNESELIRFSEYKEAFTTKNIRNDYLTGRLDGVPNLCI